jgi:hypothetical protein
MKRRIALAPIIVGIVIGVGILFVGYKDAHQDCGVESFGAPACQASTTLAGLHVAYWIAAVMVMGVCIAIGIAVERQSGKPRSRHSM